MDESTEQQIRQYVAAGHPLGDELSRWQQGVRAFGTRTPQVLMAILRDGDIHDRPAAVYGLRAFGYEAWAEEFGADEFYRVREPGTEDWMTVAPEKLDV